MKKYCLLSIFFIFLLFTLCGCTSIQNTSNYYDDKTQTIFNEGYDEGYFWGFEDGLSVENYEDEYLEFQRAVINLMYDYEYDAVNKLMKYCPELVGSFLEYEFGTNDISEIIDYLEKERQLKQNTIVGKCKYCGEDVFEIDAIICYGNINGPIETSYWHEICYDANENKNNKERE